MFVGTGSWNSIAAKHSENRLKFSGQVAGMSSGEATFLTASSWEGEKLLVARDMMSVGEGDAEPFVASAHTRVREPSN